MKFEINLSLLVMFLITEQFRYSLKTSRDLVNDETINKTVYTSNQGVSITNNSITIILMFQVME